MATAAVYDARQKDKRRQHLDREIAEAKTNLAVLFEEANARDLVQIVTSATPDIFYSKPLGTKDTLGEICEVTFDHLERLNKALFNRRWVLARLRSSLGLPWNSSEIALGVSTLDVCEALLASEQRNPSIAHRETRTETHLARATDMINDLVDRLQQEAYLQSESEAPGAHPSLDSPDSTRTMIRFLRSDGYPAYSHPELDPQAAVETRARLNDVNMEILAGWRQPHRERLVAKICYNLLVCGVPPAIQNYNALIHGFSQLGEHRLAQAVVDSFLYKSHLKPTEATCLCLLHHYRTKRDVVGFWKILHRFFGRDPRGIGLRRKTAEDIKTSRFLRSWVAATDVNIAKGYFVECVPLNKNVMEAIVEGLIDLNMLQEAAKVFVVFLYEKWKVNMKLLRRLLYACLTMQDDVAAKIIVGGLVDNIDKATDLLLGPEPVPHMVVRKLHHLFNICQSSSLSVSLYDRNTQPSGLRPPPSDTNINHITLAVWIRETSNHVRIMNQTLSRARKVLSVKRQPLGDRLDRAIELLDYETDRRAWKQQKAELIKRIAHLDWLQRQTAVMSVKIQVLQQEILGVLLEGVPRALHALPEFQFNSRNFPFPDRLALALQLRDPRSLRHRVGACLTTSQDIDHELKLALYDGLPSDMAEKVYEERDENDDVSLERVTAFFEEYLGMLGVQIKKEKKTKKEQGPRGKGADPFAVLKALPQKGMAILKGQAASF